MRAYWAVFVSVFLAELGDKTQLATVIFATSPAVRPVGVFLAAAGALVLSTAVAVALGTQVGQWAEPRFLTRLAALGFIGIGLWMLMGR